MAALSIFWLALVWALAFIISRLNPSFDFEAVFELSALPAGWIVARSHRYVEVKKARHHKRGH